ncbi:DDE-type integrase/transposase/recombinase [Streptomyces hygroscopicus]|uniref:DDE-type integrase/transposase/recombinase n=1 Tax=Streptomyces hygroscopicus TaxID=1912 RepID=UPI0006908A52|nr:DDE-type integrase/transposase/recombinase [Streptomyces hygroscopicus]
MTGGVGLLEVRAGSRLRFDGLDWSVAGIEPQFGRVLLRSEDGRAERRSFRWLMQHPDCRVLAAIPVATTAERQPPTWGDLTEAQQTKARLRAAHLLEAETGYRSGDPRLVEPGEPREAYDPDHTTLSQRRQAKVAELKALGRDEAAALGLDHISERTLKRMAAAWRRDGLLGCADGRWLRESGGRRSVSEEVREAIFAVQKETVDRSRMSMRSRERLIHQYVRAKFGPEVKIPDYDTLKAVWRKWFGPGGARQRYVRSAEQVETSTARMVVHRPGQVVALDTTVLPVKARESVFGGPVSAHLTLALDCYSHSLVAFRLTLVSDTSVDVAMLLREVMMPLPMRAGWIEDMEWPYPGVPATVVAQLAGHRAAALPFVTPETVTTDHGGPYKSHHLVEAERTLGCNVLPARTLRPTYKQAVERTFGGIRSLLFEVLPGYTGVDVADRGADPERDAVLTLEAMEHLIATWIVKVWQNRRLGEYAPAWGPGEEHSPNTLFAAAMNQGGFALQIPKPELYYRLLPPHYVKIHARRGVKVGGLWYGKDHPALRERWDQPLARGGRHKGKWVIRSDRRDRRTVFFQDPADAEVWHVLRWNGLPPEEEVPAFSSATADALLSEARSRGVSPHSDADLLPVLLELLGGTAQTVLRVRGGRAVRLPVLTAPPAPRLPRGRSRSLRPACLRATSPRPPGRRPRRAAARTAPTVLGRRLPWLSAIRRVPRYGR